MKRKRAQYQKNYHAENAEAANHRKEKERAQRIRAATYWRARLLMGRELPALLGGISKQIIDQEEAKYRATLAEPVQVEIIHPGGGL